ncbi:MAG: hypothetical protein ACLQF0_14375 [Dissulfurispiraceae bacterium]
MSQIIKQPNGKYALFSSVVYGFTATDLSREKIIEEFLQDKRESITGNVLNICDKLDKGEKAYHQFSMTWEDAKKEHEKNHCSIALSYGHDSRHVEPLIIINGQVMTDSAAMTVRVAIEHLFSDLTPDGLGDDAHGKRMTELYKSSIELIRRAIFA